MAESDLLRVQDVRDAYRLIGERLGLSHATTHQYVTALYRHLGDRTRAQLLPTSSSASGARNGAGL
jgi:DNA-binding CsgD family transcriptional regulator